MQLQFWSFSDTISHTFGGGGYFVFKENQITNELEDMLFVFKEKQI